MLSQRDLTSTFAENLLKQFEKEDDSKTKLTENKNVIDSKEIDLKNAIKCETNSSTTVTEAILKNEIKSEPILKIEKLEFAEKICFNNRMLAKEILEATRKLDPADCPATCSILAPETPPPTPPEIPEVKMTREQLQPPTPSVFLENKKHAFSPQLQEFCLKHPIAVIRQLASALKLGK
jgi:lysine-specific demethylase 6A